MRLLFVITEDRYFVSHRLHLARSAIEAGYRVGFAGNVTNHRQIIESAGVEVIDWKINRGSVNPFTEAKSVFNLIRLMRRFKPDVVHCVSVKPVLYAAVACKILGITSRVCALGGLGYVFSSQQYLAKILRPLVIFTLRMALKDNQSRLILQNSDDQTILLSAGVTAIDRIRLIRGAGVDSNLFTSRPTTLTQGAGIPLVVLPARLLWDKGVGEFVACARILAKKGTKARFALVGEADVSNPESVPAKQLQKWEDEGIVECWGYKNNMPAVYRQASIVCLPSYREGLPRSLLEAASCGLPIVTCDVPGCREVVIDNVNGFLVPSQDENMLLQALEKLIEDRELCARFGEAGRELVLAEFSREQVATETMQVWQEVLP